MSSIQVRPFRRRDREQLTGLVNAHAAAVVPGQGVSVSALLSHLERQPGEAIVDPWVSERLTLVAEQLDRVVAAAHLLRYFGDERAGQAYRGTRGDPLAAVLAGGTGRQPVLAGRHRSRRAAHRRLYPPAR